MYGLVQSKHDPVLFTCKHSNEVIGALIVHVDDIIVSGIPTFVADLRTKLQKRFKMSKMVR